MLALGVFAYRDKADAFNCGDYDSAEDARESSYTSCFDKTDNREESDRTSDTADYFEGEQRLPNGRIGEYFSNVSGQLTAAGICKISTSDVVGRSVCVASVRIHIKISVHISLLIPKREIYL